MATRRTPPKRPARKPKEKPATVTAPIARVALTDAAKAFGQEVIPAGTQLGRTTKGLVNIATAPLRALIWGYERVEEKLLPLIEKKVSEIPKENLVNPNPTLIGSTLDGSKFSLESEHLCEMFANLAASAFDKDKFDNCHPSFPLIIQNLSGEDAFAAATLWRRCGHPRLDVPCYFPIVTFSRLNSEKGSYIYIRDASLLLLWMVEGGYCDEFSFSRNSIVLDNLERLGIITKHYQGTLPISDDRNPYDKILYHPKIVEYSKIITTDGDKHEAMMGYASITEFGRIFLSIVTKK